MIHLSSLIAAFACQFLTPPAVIGRDLQNDVGRLGPKQCWDSQRHHQRAAKISRHFSGPIELWARSGDGRESSPGCLDHPCHDSPRSPQTPFSSLGSRCDARGVFCVYPPVSQHSRSRASCGPEKDVIKFVLPVSSRSLIFWLPTPLASPRWPCPLQWTRCSRPMRLGLNLQEPRVPNLDRRPFGQDLRRCVHPNHPSSTVRSGLSGSGLIHAQGGRTGPPDWRCPFPRP